MTRNQRETNELFDGWANTYDQDLAADPGGPLTGYAQSLTGAARLVRAGQGERVLDIGVGTGAFAALLAADGAEIWGVDPSAAMLERCKDAYPGFRLAPGAFGPLDFPAATFDVVASSFAWHHVPPAERPAALAEVRRVLRPGGRFCLLDIVFASAAAQAAARDEIGSDWDDDEEYALVGDLDELLLTAGWRRTRWRQTGPYHWAVSAEPS